MAGCGSQGHAADEQVELVPDVHFHHWIARRDAAGHEGITGSLAFDERNQGLHHPDFVCPARRYENGQERRRSSSKPYGSTVGVLLYLLALQHRLLPASTQRAVEIQSRDSLLLLRPGTQALRSA